ncbi:MAG: ribonuclease III [Pseudomonadales bacterium]|nr:ribonuclease III [Pseudomonadales bacterium]
MSNKYQRLEKKLGYVFTDQANLELALTHRSYSARNNERLEFLGDSVLNFIIAEYLYQNFPKLKEGHLSRQRAGLVRGTTLAEIAREFELGDYLFLGSGELKSGGFRRDSILADAVEGIIGAIYLEAGFSVVQARILDWYAVRLKKLSDKGIQKDPKTLLQEYLQSRQIELPCYDVVSITGEAHAQTFFVECTVQTLSDKTVGQGTSRRQAEQNAAQKALIALGVESSHE